MSQSLVSVIGAGISGLIAANVLEKNGVAVQLFEASDRVGGRLQTDFIENYQLDHGFQVLLGAYPAARKYLNFDQLELQELIPGSSIYEGKRSLFGDPTRDIRFFLPVLITVNATFKDKFLIFLLQRKLTKTPFQELFEKPELATIDYLRLNGFSELIIQHFFKPFFSGIFLENELASSSRMFEFVFKCFAEGKAFIPKNGIQAIPNQLYHSLNNTKVHFNVKIDKVENEKLYIEGIDPIDSDFTIIATEPNELIHNLRNQELVWNSCECLYFEVDKEIERWPIIGLLPSSRSLVNNIFFPQTIKTGSRGQKGLLSVTVVKEHDLSESDLIENVKSDLNEFCGIKAGIFLKNYRIKKALPKLEGIQYDLASSETQLTSSVFLAGDQMLNASLNAAIISGERAAEAVLDKIKQD